MRIVYDWTGQSPILPAGRPTAAGKTGETVIVLKLGNRQQDNPAEKSKAGQEIRFTPEALARDQEVRGHEKAHLSSLGPYAASLVQYDTASVPGGGSVAVGGKIAVDLAEVPGDPAATLRKARTVFAAANAPGDPSAADLRVAARAYGLMLEAKKELETSEYA
jgi:hypothetical protein